MTFIDPPRLARRGFRSRGGSSSRVRKQGHLPCVLHRGGHRPLVLRAVAGDSPSPDLAALGHELTQQRDVLVVDEVDLLFAEHAELLLLLLLPALLLFLPAWLASFLRHLDRRL